MGRDNRFSFPFFFAIKEWNIISILFYVFSPKSNISDRLEL